MTRGTSARIAGFTFLAYIAAGVTDMIVRGRAIAGADVPARLAAVASHAADVRISILLGMVQCFAALVLAVTLYGVTRRQNHELAVLAMTCRIVEGVFVGGSVPDTLSLRWLANLRGANALDPEATRALGAYLLRGDVAFTATFFSVGSLLFAWLLLRGRMIPAWLAWVGVAASALLVVGLPLQLVGLLGGPVASMIWLPMLAFEVPVGFLLMARGVPDPPESPAH